MPQATLLRRSVADLNKLARRDLDDLWRQVDTAVQAREALRDVLPLLVETYGSAAATVAADWYDDERDKAAARGRFFAIPAEVGETGTDALARWGVAPLFAGDPDWKAAATLVQGGLQRRIANAARHTVTRSSVADPAARGWERVGDGSACEFCSMLLGRGAVYTEASADFAAHDHCGCTAAPAWR